MLIILLYSVNLILIAEIVYNKVIWLKFISIVISVFYMLDAETRSSDKFTTSGSKCVEKLT